MFRPPFPGTGGGGRWSGWCIELLSRSKLRSALVDRPMAMMVELDSGRVGVCCQIALGWGIVHTM